MMKNKLELKISVKSEAKGKKLKIMKKNYGRRRRTWKKQSKIGVKRFERFFKK